jgi:uncharacterized iron-regulated protein
MLHSMKRNALLSMMLVLAGCACPWALATASPAALLIFGEQHDQPDEQRQVAAEVRKLATAQRLAAVVLEMAEAPHQTSALPRDASEAQVREALQWQGWPWPAYSEVVMNAVRAGVPVLGGNLPRSSNRAAMLDATLDQRIDAKARALIADAVRSGHCQLLPASQEPGMVRIQMARDESMAQVSASALRAAPPGTKVLLLTGAQHASRDRGVPLHLQASHGLEASTLHVVVFGDGDDGLLVDERRAALFTPQADHCAELRKRLEDTAKAPAAAASAQTR